MQNPFLNNETPFRKSLFLPFPWNIVSKTISTAYIDKLISFNFSFIILDIQHNPNK